MHVVPALRAIAISFFIFSTGCATIMTGGGTDQKVRIGSRPRGASIYVDDQFKGLTPMSVSMTRKDSHSVRMELTGYKTYEKELTSGFNLWFVGNVVIGGIIGMLVDTFDGAVIALSSNDIDARLVSTSAPVPRGSHPLTQ